MTLGALLVRTRQSRISSDSCGHTCRLFNVGDQLMLKHQRSRCKFRVRAVSTRKQKFSILLVLSRVQHVVACVSAAEDHQTPHTYPSVCHIGPWPPGITGSTPYSPLETKSRRHYPLSLQLTALLPGHDMRYSGYCICDKLYFDRVTSTENLKNLLPTGILHRDLSTPHTTA